MATVSFLLKEPNADRPTPIFAFLSFDGRRAKVYTSLTVHPRQWSKEDQRAQTRGYPANGHLNDSLAFLRERLLGCYAEHRAIGEVPSIEVLRAQAIPVEKVIEPEKNVPERPIRPNLLDAYAAWTESQRGKSSVNTLRSNTTTWNHLVGFQQQKGFAVDFDTITPAFAERFTSYLLEEVKLTDNSIAKVLARLKSFLSYAVDHGLTVNRGFDKLKWNRQEPDILTLTESELQAIEAVDLSGRPALQNARALFLLSCYTGLRYSDLIAIRTEHLQGDKLRLRTQKTRDSVTIPLRASARALVEQVLAGEIYLIANQKLNGYLKELAKRAGLDTPVELVRYRGGQRDCQLFQKWQRITCHTGRRTFVTLSLERRIRPEVVMKVTGHRSWQSFKRYVNITEQSVEQEFTRAYATPCVLKD